jgi:hypothetical protein
VLNAPSCIHLVHISGVVSPKNPQVSAPISIKREEILSIKFKRPIFVFNVFLQEYPNKLYSSNPIIFNFKCSHLDVLSPSQCPTCVPLDGKFERDITIDRLFVALRTALYF